jgi:hypothetical protein
MGIDIKDILKVLNVCNKKKKGLRKGILSDLGVNLNERNTDEVLIGREKEIGEIIEILFCKNKNNPILIGEAGVGKTAIIEELAKKIAASITDKGIGNLVIGSAFNIGKPEDYNYNKSDAHFKDISKFCVNANILSHKGSFLMSIFAGTDIIISQYDEAEGRYIKSFNPKAQIRYINFYVYPKGNGLAKENLQTSIQISKTLATELKAKGWKTYVESKYGYVLTKGDLCVGNWLNEGTYMLGIGYKNLLEDENTEKKHLENDDKRIEEILAGE